MLIYDHNDGKANYRLTQTMHRHIRYLISGLLSALLLTLGTGTVIAQQGSGQLPEMGDSSGTLLSLQDELRIGREMLQRLDRSGAVIHDLLVEEYIQGLGRGLSSAAVTERNHFHFFVVGAPSINAFAMPGGFIGVHSGLILASENESELAAVIAHEIAHVTQHHIARGVERASQMNLPMTAAVIAAILLGGGDPQVAQAAMAAGMGASRQMQLDFTRANEKEADRVGIQLLAASEFDTQGMSDFFGKLQEQSRYYGEGVPEFLRTHPVTTSRIAEAQDRARQYPPAANKQASLNYQLVKARLRLHQANSAEELLQQLDAESPDNNSASEAERYLRALTLQSQGEYKQARVILASLLQYNPGRIAYIHAMAELEAADNNADKASALLAKGLELYPGNRILTLTLSRELISQAKYEPAREHIDGLLRRDPDDARAYHLLAELEAGSGNLAASHLAQAEYYYLNGEPHSAIDQLHTARRLPAVPDYYAARISARLGQIKDELSRIRSE